MVTSFRVEIDGLSSYFDSHEDAVRYFLKNYNCKHDGELWLVTSNYSNSIKRYIATQTLLDYYEKKQR